MALPHYQEYKFGKNNKSSWLSLQKSVCCLQSHDAPTLLYKCVCDPVESFSLCCVSGDPRMLLLTHDSSQIVLLFLVRIGDTAARLREDDPDPPRCLSAPYQVTGDSCLFLSLFMQWLFALQRNWIAIFYPLFIQKEMALYGFCSHRFPSAYSYHASWICPWKGNLRTMPSQKYMLYICLLKVWNCQAQAETASDKGPTEATKSTGDSRSQTLRRQTLKICWRYDVCLHSQNMQFVSWWYIFLYYYPVTHKWFQKCYSKFFPLPLFFLISFHAILRIFHAVPSPPILSTPLFCSSVSLYIPLVPRNVKWPICDSKRYIRH